MKVELYKQEFRVDQWPVLLVLNQDGTAIAQDPDCKIFRMRFKRAEDGSWSVKPEANDEVFEVCHWPFQLIISPAARNLIIEHLKGLDALAVKLNEVAR